MMKLKSYCRLCKDHIKVTIYKNTELRTKCKIGDILILKYKDYEFIRPIQEDYCVSLPLKHFCNYSDFEKVELEVLGIYKTENCKIRPTNCFFEDKLDLRYFISLKTQFNIPIYILKKDEYTSIVYYPRGGYARPVTVRNYVDPIKLSELIGFFFGDGSKSKGLRSFRITNCEPFILNYCIDILDSIVIQKSEYRCQIIYSSNNSLTDSIKNRCIEFWSRKLNLSKKSFVSVNLNKSKTETLPYGSVRIQNNSTVLTEVFLYGVMNKLLHILLNPTSEMHYKMIEGFFRGLLAAEGYSSSFKGNLRTVGIAVNPHSDEPLLYQKLLFLLGINSTIRKNHNSLIIYRYVNFIKMYKMKAFSLYPSKKEKFEKAFLNLQKSINKQLTPYFNLLT